MQVEAEEMRAPLLVFEKWSAATNSASTKSTSSLCRKWDLRMWTGGRPDVESGAESYPILWMALTQPSMKDTELKENIEVQ